MYEYGILIESDTVMLVTLMQMYLTEATIKSI
jgi:hypothetical protein